MRVIAENLPIGTSSEFVKREFQRAGPCKVEVHVNSTQDTTAFIDYLDIVNANNAIKLFHGKSFDGKIITVKKHFDSIINLSVKRPQTSDSVISLAPRSETLILSSKKSEPKINGGTVISLNKPAEPKATNEDQIIKFRKIEEAKVQVLNNPPASHPAPASPSKSSKETLETNKSTSTEEASLKLPTTKTVGRAEKVLTLENNSINQVTEVKPLPQSKDLKPLKVPEESKKEPEAKAKAKETVKEPETKAKPKETVQKTEKALDEQIVEKEGNKFRRSSDGQKLVCILCNKEITEKSIKTHVNSKTHMALM